MTTKSPAYSLCVALRTKAQSLAAGETGGEITIFKNRSVMPRHVYLGIAK